MNLNKPKYKVGDYLAGEGRVFARIRAYIEGEEHIYAIELPDQRETGTKMHWYSEFELDDRFGATAVQAPDFKRYARLEAGDILHVDKDIYTTVLAKIGDLVLLSDIPHKAGAEHTIHKLAEQIKELTEGQIDMEDLVFDEEDKQSMKNHASSRYVKRVASMWKPTDWVALMNWKIVEE